MTARDLWSRVFTIVGGIAMVVGAVDPIEGSLLIVPGTGLVAVGTYVAHGERRLVVYRVWVFIMVAIGVGAMWGLSAVGGFGGSTGRSYWLALLVLPYLVGWSMGIGGPGSPRWMLWLGILVSLWYLTLAAMILMRTSARHGDLLVSVLPSIAIAALGVLTIGGCINRLRTRTTAHQLPAPPETR